ncbi:CehA/McbA family metallohydrolase [Cohnella silvisoli]|uniref:CehA/McbA family metallohydrolase n=1 Tax=Cohnella silvisoli TaxID=2873699 RepID=A0ABV1KXW3_9BACL|nr:CehA/McbA family metallohydrolase [Cohnella silvisoli]MCD9023958.1 CehA/McbA family metallohydrolase [Cohnella silvisoli]
MSHLRESQTISGNQEHNFGAYTKRFNVSMDWIILRLDFEESWGPLLLWDPNGELRVQYLHYRNFKTVVLHRDPLYSSYLTVPGPLPLGEWKFEILGSVKNFSIQWECGSGSLPDDVVVHNGQAGFWSATGHEDEDGAIVLSGYDWNSQRNQAKKWYKGDFHTHTILSDGKLTPEEGMRQAEKMGLDFFVATDHNLIPTVWPEGYPLVIPGMEITSSKGHFNALGLKKWVDWRQSGEDGGMESEEGMNRVLEDTAKAGALRSINHPMLAPWDWLFKETKLANIDTMEIWNDPTFPGNPQATEKALILWNALWNEGYRIPGIGGSDSHNLPTESYEDNGPPSLIGEPATYVLSDGLSAGEILKAVKRGNVYVTRGPVLDIAITVGKRNFVVGDDLTSAVNAAEDGMVHCLLVVSNQTSGSIRWIENGIEVLAQPIGIEDKYECVFDWNNAEYVWRRIEIRGNEGELLAFTNPVYCGEKKPGITTWDQLIDKVSGLL